MARVEVITGPERRRRWSEDQKRAIVAESFVPGAVVSNVARRADISAGQIYHWRQELRATATAAAGIPALWLLWMRRYSRSHQQGMRLGAAERAMALEQ